MAQEQMLIFELWTLMQNIFDLKLPYNFPHDPPFPCQCHVTSESPMPWLQQTVGGR